MTLSEDDPSASINLETIIATSSSVCFVLVALSLVLSFIVGFACGRCNKRFNDKAAKDDLLKSCDKPFRLAKGYPNIEAVYECPDNIGRVKHQSHEPQLEENVAYAPLHHFQP